ncbi:ranBP1 domain-containing protein [Ditylenchus destructor]|uniref:RanBP1 domain-containing protein n=1 Tax=Ditylenchus destructor TaxID=166010 RepID=A0AAD4RAX5_9BILA|nr:ranBP1 domain-containing protein [Ditylenchus destructor]
MARATGNVPMNVPEIEDLLQSHNSLIMSMLKSFNESTQTLNKNLASVVGELRQLKLQVNELAAGPLKFVPQALVKPDTGAKKEPSLFQQKQSNVTEGAETKPSGSFSFISRTLEKPDTGAKKEPSLFQQKQSNVTEGAETKPSGSFSFISRTLEKPDTGAKKEPSLFQQKQSNVTEGAETKPSGSFSFISRTLEKPDTGAKKEPSLFQQKQSNVTVGAETKPSGSFSFTSRTLEKPDTGAKKESSPFQVKQSNAAEGAEEDEDKVEEYVPNAYFEPVIPLPELVEIKTGEENEITLLTARCKLFRFDKQTKEYKERGVGEIKLLDDQPNGKSRVVMRRDQTLKICANFPIFKSLKMTQKSGQPTVYTWACKDFSDPDFPDGVDEVFSARFKDAQIAVGFADNVNEAAQKSGLLTNC